MASNKALLIVDVQNDFCPGGALPAREGDQVVPVLNRYIDRFVREGGRIYASRDWHPEGSAHFQERGGPWPPHCVQGTEGAQFHSGLALPADVTIITKGDDPNEDEGYSAFDGTTAEGRSLAEDLREHGIEEVHIGGLATDYCVKATALDARNHGFTAILLVDAVRGVELEPGDSERAIQEIRGAGVEVRA